MPDTEPHSPPEPSPVSENKPAFAEAFSAAAKRSGFAQVAPGESPTPSSLLGAIGGVRGLIESILPGLSFLVIYTLSKNLFASVLAPLVVSLVFIAVRLLQRTPVMSAFAGACGVAISAGLALLTGRAEDNFVPGFITNAVSACVLLVSVLARWPLIGVIVGLLTGDISGWRHNREQFRAVYLATWCWVALFSLRLAIQLPLYFSRQPEALAATKLILGVPLYAAMLWVTWLLIRSAFGHRNEKTEING